MTPVCRRPRGMRLVVVGAVVGCALGVSAGHAMAQEAPPAATAALGRALDAETAGRNREAIGAYREAMARGATLQGLLGLERVFSLLAQEDSVLPVAAAAIAAAPSDPQLRGVQLRTLVTLRRDAEAGQAFAAWRDAAPGDLAPFRDYARVLLFNNRAAAADTVLAQAAHALGSTRGLALEVAQMRAGLRQWRESAVAWREVVGGEPYYESSAVFSLTPAPREARDAVREVLRAPGGAIGVAQTLALLEVAWGAPRAGWTVLQGLPPTDTTVAVWRQFAEEVERGQAWAVARDALRAIHQARPDAEVAIRGARAALRSGDATTALALVRGSGALDSARRVADAIPLELEALAELGRGGEAEALLAREAAALGPDGVRAQARLIAWAWVRAGDVTRARAALRGAPLAAEDAVAGWLALYEGDLDAARQALRHVDAPGQDVVAALALLNRTRQSRAPAVGGAFLALARRDSVQASRAFEAAASDVPDGAPVLLALAARVAAARGDEARALTLWARLVARHADAPEAAEAHLEWARTLRRRGDVAGARTHLETLILTYPGSALLPQARRELDALPATTD